MSRPISRSVAGTLGLLALSASLGCQEPGGQPGGRAPAVLNQAILTEDQKLTGTSAGDHFGVSVSGAGDVDGDGYDDVVVGASGVDLPDDSTGAVFLYPGSATGVDIATETAFTASDVGEDFQFGDSVASAGDVNGDGYGDVIVGAPAANSSAGTAYAYLGSASGLDLQTETRLTATDTAASQNFGASVSGAGDFDGDGYSDVIVGAFGDISYTGAAYVYYGSVNGIDPATEFKVTASDGANYQYFGYAVASAGDVDGDGYDDAVIGAIGAIGPGYDSGAAYVYFGSAGGLDLATEHRIDASDAAAFAYFGASVAGDIDVNGDGYGDLLVGATGTNDSMGTAYVYLGSAGGVGAETILNASDGTGGDYFGRSVDGAGDLDGDGYDDVVVGAYVADSLVNPGTGVAYTYLGSASGVDSVTEQKLEPTDGMDNDFFGGSVAGGFDLDGNGFPDIVIGAMNESSVDTEAGATYVYTCVVPPTWYVDVDGDGYGDDAVSTASCTRPVDHVADNTDCDDADASIHPGAAEQLDGIDQDCDGWFDEGVLPADALVITEVMKDTVAVDDWAGEWFEVHNTTGIDLNLVGLLAADLSGEQFTVEGDLWVVSGGYVVFGHRDDMGINGGVVVDYEIRWDLILDEQDELILTHDGIELDRVEWDNNGIWPDTPAKALSLDPDHLADNDDGTMWCEAVNVFGDGDMGTPGQVNPHCCLDEDGDGHLPTSCGGGDCDDADASLSPDADEWCDGIDNDCNGVLDDDHALDVVAWYLDADGDVYGDAAQAELACDAPSGYVADDTDCDDGDPSVHPDAAEEPCDHVDSDCDGVLHADEQDGDGDGFDVCGGDCDDTDAEVHPGHDELCNGIDDDCGGDVDEDDAIDARVWYRDLDGDGFGDLAVSDLDCDQPAGHVLGSTDCDDADADVHPGATEDACDAIDNDCDGALHPEEVDDDGDGLDECGGDCDDGDADVLPGAAEILCDGIDNDCDPSTLDGDDADGDGWTECDDCNEADPAIHPGAEEVCNGLDDDCDVATNEVADDDADGYSLCDGDCDDAEPDTFPGNPEVCDGIDNDCDEATDELADADADGFAICDDDCADDEPGSFPGSPEVCDGLDNDCDGSIPADEIDDDLDGQLICAGDCDDNDDTTYDGAPEQCDGLDNDCDDVIDEDVDEDLDGDGYNACQGDCDNEDETVFPGADELCDGRDNDCNGEVPADELDDDGDGTTPCEGDCDDTEAAMSPEWSEVCDDGLDNDCDGWTDEEDVDDCEAAGDDDDIVGDDDDAAEDDDDSSEDSSGDCSCRLAGRAQGGGCLLLLPLGLLWIGRRALDRGGRV